MNLIETLKYPLSDLKNLAIGSVLTGLWFFFIPLLAVNGYVVRIIRETLQGNNTLPSWKDPKYLLLHGFFLSIIILGYLFVPFILTYAATGISGFDSTVALTATEDLPQLNPLSLTLIILSTISFFFIVFILPMVIFVYAASEQITTAFNIPLLLSKILIDPVNYIKVFVINLGIFALFSVLAVPLTVFAGLILIYPAAFSARLFADAFKDLV